MLQILQGGWKILNLVFRTGTFITKTGVKVITGTGKVGASLNALSFGYSVYTLATDDEVRFDNGEAYPYLISAVLTSFGTARSGVAVYKTVAGASVSLATVVAGTTALAKGAKSMPKTTWNFIKSPFGKNFSGIVQHDPHSFTIWMKAGSRTRRPIPTDIRIDPKTQSIFVGPSRVVLKNPKQYARYVKMLGASGGVAMIPLVYLLVRMGEEGGSAGFEREMMLHFDNYLDFERNSYDTVRDLEGHGFTPSLARYSAISLQPEYKIAAKTAMALYELWLVHESGVEFALELLAGKISNFFGGPLSSSSAVAKAYSAALERRDEAIEDYKEAKEAYNETKADTDQTDPDDVKALAKAKEELDKAETHARKLGDLFNAKETRAFN